mgnify:CR=1 FL=1
MTDFTDTAELRFGSATEDLVNFIYQSLPDEIADEVRLHRTAPDNIDIAREPTTIAAILTFSAMHAPRIVGLIERWMEGRRQGKAAELIYKAGKENPGVIKVLADLEKRHTGVMVQYKSGSAGKTTRS